MKALKSMLNEAINVYDRFRAKPHTKLTFIIVCSGVALTAPSWWDRIFTIIEKIVSQNPNIDKIEPVPNTNDLYFLFSGLFLVVFGIGFYVFLEIKSKKQTKGNEKIDFVGLEAGTSDNEKRKRDIKTVTKLMSNIHTNTIDYFIYRGKHDRIINNIFYYWEGFRADYVSSGFHVYDVELAEKIDAFFKAWGNSLSFGEWFTDTPSFKEYRFMQRHETDRDGWVESKEKFIKSIYETESTFSELLNYLRNEFEEIDINLLSEKAQQDYIEYHRDLEEE
jgi:hypothetical protein